MSRRAPAAALLLVAFALRVFRLGEANVWWDEALAVWAVRKSFVGTTLWTAADVHPPLFFWLQWPWLRLAGQTEFAVRLVPVGVGVLAAALAYSLGRRLGGPRAGLIALTFVTVARFEVWWSMELRMYMLAAATILLATYAAARWLGTGEHLGGSRQDTDQRSEIARSTVHTRPFSHRWLMAYVVGGTCALYTIYMAVVAVAALALSGLAILGWQLRRSSPENRSSAKRNIWYWIAAQAAVVALLLPWLALAVPRMQSWTSLRGDPASLSFVVRLWATLMATGVSTAIDTAQMWTLLFWACVLVIPLAAIGIGRWRAGMRPSYSKPSRVPSTVFSVLLLGPFLVLPPLAVWAATQPRSLFYSPSVEARYLLPFAGPVYVLAAVVLSRAWERARLAGAVLAVGAVAALLVFLPDHFAPRRLRDVMQSMTLAIWSQAEAGDAVVLLSGNRYPMFLYYYDQPWDVDHARETYEWPADAPPRQPDRPPVIMFPNRSTDVVGDVDWQDRLERILADHDRVWLAEIESHLQDPNDEVETWLNDHMPRVLSEGYGPNALHLYDPDGDAPRLTGVSSYWPWTRELVYPICDLPRCLPGPFESYWGLLLAYHKMVGAPVRAAMPGDSPGFTLFELDDPVGQPDPDAVFSLWSLPEHPQSANRSAPWSQVWAQTAFEDNEPRRVHMQIPATDRLPAGRGYVYAYPNGGVMAPLTVRGTRPPLSELQDAHAHFGFVRLDDIAASSTQLHPGDSLVVDLYWQLPVEVLNFPTPTEPIPASPPTVFVHLIGPPHPETGNRVWAGHDGPPSSGPWHTQALLKAFDRHVLDLDPAAPPGDYQLVVGLYDPVTMERYDVSGDDADDVARHATLGTVSVKQSF